MSNCIKCNLLNEYISTKNWVCYNCKDWYPEDKEEDDEEPITPRVTNLDWSSWEVDEMFVDSEF